MAAHGGLDNRPFRVTRLRNSVGDHSIVVQTKIAHNAQHKIKHVVLVGTVLTASTHYVHGRNFNDYMGND